MEIDVSVVLPAYNLERYIERGIRAALAQENVALEVLVIDDCSKDSTLERARGFTDPRVRVFQTEKNGGCGVARNVGLAQARGRWVAIFDGDDDMAPDRLSRMIALGEREGADMVVDNLMLVPEGEKPLRPMFPEPDFATLKTFTLPLFMRKKFVWNSNHPLAYVKPVVRRDFLEKHNFRYQEGIPIGEDYLFVAEFLALGGKCVVDHHCGYLYTIRPGSISYRVPSTAIEEMLVRERAFQDRFGAGFDMATRFRFIIRQLYLREMLAFTKTVEALKARKLVKALGAALSFPTSARLFWEAIWKRIKRLF